MVLLGQERSAGDGSMFHIILAASLAACVTAGAAWVLLLGFGSGGVMILAVAAMLGLVSGAVDRTRAGLTCAHRALTLLLLSGAGVSARSLRLIRSIASLVMRRIVALRSMNGRWPTNASRSCFARGPNFDWYAVSKRCDVSHNRNYGTFLRERFRRRMDPEFRPPSWGPGVERSSRSTSL